MLKNLALAVLLSLSSSVALAAVDTSTTQTDTAPVTTDTTTAVVVTPKSPQAPATVTSTTTIVQTKTPKDMIGWAGGAFHNAGQFLAMFVAFMTMLRVVAEVLTEVGNYLVVLAAYTKVEKIKQAAAFFAWGVSILAWIVAIFSAGTPSRFAVLMPPAPKEPEVLKTIA